MPFALVRGRYLLAGICFLAAVLVYPCAARAVENTDRCDELAAHPQDTDRWAQGVKDEEIVPALAIKACTESVEAHPDEPRFNFQLGRALQAAARYDEAVAHFNRAGVEGGYAPALGYLGVAFLNGWGGRAQDEKAARELLQASAEGGFGAAADVLAALDEPKLPFDGKADPRRKDRYLKKFDANAFSFPYFAQALFEGDFDGIPRPLGVIYSRNFHGMFAPGQRGSVHYDDPRCTLAYDPSVEASAKLEYAGATLAMAGVLAGLASSPDALNATGKAAEGFVEWFYGSPATAIGGALVGMVVLETKLDELWGKVRYDHEQFVVNNGCESPDAQRFLGNIKAYILGTVPERSPEVAERVSIHDSSGNLRQSCAREFGDERFCACALDQLLSSGLDAQTWRQIESGMEGMTRLSPDLGLRAKVQACYG